MLNEKRRMTEVEQIDADRSQEEINRIGWRSRRGMAELDIIFVPFFNEVFPHLSAERQSTYIRMLDEEDPVLWEWFSERAAPEEKDYFDLVSLMLRRLQP
jgi:antitoxin CptB